MKRLSLIIALLAIVICGSCAKSSDKVILGDERPQLYLPLLEGKRVALFSNQTGIVGDRIENSLLPALTQTDDKTCRIPFLTPADSTKEVLLGAHILDALIAESIEVTTIFSPEHGFRGTADAGERVGSSIDAKTGVPIVSLYDKNSPFKSDEILDSFDVLVVDIQDVGLRFYTYYISMYKLMNVCARAGKQVVVLDRPNPNGSYVDGPILDMSLKSGVGGLPVPVVHGMTLGELALMINGEGWLADGLKCKLTVIPMENYTHAMNLNLILPPSPNLKDMKAVLLYPSTCYFEGTVVSLGRGTSFPFEVYGHPDMKDCDFSFTPRSIPGAKNPVLLDRKCYGRDLRDKPIDKILSEKLNFGYIIDAYEKLAVGDDFFLKNGFFELLSGQRWVRAEIENGMGAEELSAKWRDDVLKFEEQRSRYLLYP